jgi:hypothetical protein
MTSVASPLKAGHGVDISSLMELGGRNFTCYSKHHSELLHGFDEGLADFCNGFDPSRPWDVVWCTFLNEISGQRFNN